MLKALLFVLTLTIFVSLADGKKKEVEKFEEYRAWAQRQLDVIAEDLRKKGLTGYVEGGEEDGSAPSRDTTTETSSEVDESGSATRTSTMKKRSLPYSAENAVMRRGEDRPMIRTLGGETKFTSTKRRATRRLVPISATLKSKTYPEAEEVVVKDYENSGNELKEINEEQAAPEVEVNVSANTLMGSENEPFQKPLHETVDLPDETLPTSLLDERSETKPIFRKRREGKMAKLLRSLVKPLLPPADPPALNQRLQEMGKR